MKVLLLLISLPLCAAQCEVHISRQISKEEIAHRVYTIIGINNSAVEQCLKSIITSTKKESQEELEKRDNIIKKLSASEDFSQ